jgi:broad specificity phosphatase PhoE
MSILYLIRHAQASFGQKNYDCLSDLGRQQATILAGHFQDLGLEFDAVYSGSQVRHEQTADACRKNIGNPENPFPAVCKMDAFNEYDSEFILKTLIPEVIGEEPAFEAKVAAMMQDKRSFQQVYEKIMRRWVNSRHPIKHLETWKTYSDRVFAGLQKIMTAEGSKKKVAIFTSGGPISVCVQKALNLSDDHTLQVTWQIMNASVTRLKYSNNRLMLFGFNDVTHLELQKDAQLLTYR